MLLTDFHVFARKGAQRALNRLRDENAEEYRSAVHGRLALESRPVAQSRPARGEQQRQSEQPSQGALGDGREEELKLDEEYTTIIIGTAARDQRAIRPGPVRNSPAIKWYASQEAAVVIYEHRAPESWLVARLGVGPKPRVVVQLSLAYRLSDS